MVNVIGFCHVNKVAILFMHPIELKFMSQKETDSVNLAKRCDVLLSTLSRDHTFSLSLSSSSEFNLPE